MNIRIVAIVILIIVIASGIFIFFRGHYLNGNGTSQPIATTPPISSTSDWKTYINSSYGYQVSYPQNALATKYYEEDNDPLEKTEYLQIFIPGEITQFSVEAYISNTNATDSVSMELNALDALPLQQFATALHQYQIDNPNQNMKDRQVGDLTETTFAGQKAYSFTLTNGFTTPAGEYAIPTGVTFNYIAIENKAGIKLLIYYPLSNSVTETIKDSFAFIAK